jgi:DNA helicase-2/ATP-dependent DNA helicase PcrA
MQYKFSYVLHVPTAQKTYFNLGLAVHETIEHLTKQELEGIPPTKEQAEAILEQFWSSSAYATRQKEREDKERAAQMVETYLAWRESNENEVIAAEMKFQFTLDGRVVKGFIDRVERTPNGNYVVIDYKTGYQSENKNSIKHSIQMNVYSLAILEKFGALPVKASLFYVKHRKIVDYVPDPENIKQEKLRLTEMINSVILEHFPQAPSYQTCRSCSYVDVCAEKEIRRD